MGSRLEKLRTNMKEVKVLYVEDEENVRAQTLIFLKKIFTNIESASDGEEGLSLFKKNRYSLIITDLKMPKMNGREMLEHIRILDQDTIFIVMTASDSNIDASETISDAYMHKPVMFMEFIEQLEGLRERLTKR